MSRLTFYGFVDVRRSTERTAMLVEPAPGGSPGADRRVSRSILPNPAPRVGVRRTLAPGRDEQGRALGGGSPLERTRAT